MFTGRVVSPPDPQTGFPGDPMWLDTDRGYALAWRRDKAETCSSCGTRADEWAEDTDAYIGDSSPCQGCIRLAEERNNVPRDGDQPRPGYHVYLVSREQYDALHPPGTPIDH